MVPVAQAGVTPWYSTRLPSPCMTRPNWPLGEVIDWPAVSWAPETRVPDITGTAAAAISPDCKADPTCTTNAIEMTVKVTRAIG